MINIQIIKMEPPGYLSKVQGSATAKIFAKAKELEKNGKDIIHLEIGQPDFQPLEIINESVDKFVLDGYTSYTVSRGIEGLRQEIKIYHESRSRSNINHKNEIIISAGGKMALFGVLWSLINPGDNVIIFNPSWVSYGSIVTSLGGIPKYIGTDLSFNYDEELLHKIVNTRTKAIIINSPCNPTGSIIQLNNLNKLYSFCAEHEIFLISDEMYSEYVYDDNKFYSLIDIKSWKDFGIIINGVSKTFAMTGYRIGYAIAKEEIISNVNKVNQLTISCAVNFAQRAAIVAFQNISKMRAKISSIMPARRKLMSELISDLDVIYSPPNGAFYSWIKIPNLKNSIQWGEAILAKVGVAITPGKAFGPDGEGYIRISFANPESSLIEGINRINKFLKFSK